MIYKVIPITVVLLTGIIASLLARNHEKVDKGFVFNYNRLSYRRKVIRSLIINPIALLSLIIIYQFADWPSVTKTTIIIILFIATAVELGYNYTMWKKTEEST